MAAKTQDMPPPGGYQKIDFKRIPARKYFSGYQMFLGYIGNLQRKQICDEGLTFASSFLGITVGGAYLYALNYYQAERESVEMRSGQFALYPLIMAERDREFLKQFRRNRDEEAKLMANVPGWEVGTFYGEPVFKTIPKDTFRDPHWQDFCAHATYKTFADRAMFHLFN